jgi:hypothetical protein
VARSAQTVGCCGGADDCFTAVPIVPVDPTRTIGLAAKRSPAGVEAHDRVVAEGIGGF